MKDIMLQGRIDMNLLVCENAARCDHYVSGNERTQRTRNSGSPCVSMFVFFG